ncbi:MAG TPA: methyltransferase, partial [Burkholderiaceae bacterium]|nr:methyltransferase [Burkholderiaceae bacterium]
GDRCEFIAGDALESVPVGCDGYILSNFVNSLSDASVVTVLGHCRRAIRPHGRLILLEWVQATGDEPQGSYRAWDSTTMDIVMLAAFGSRGGRIRTESEFRSLLGLAGFTFSALVPTRGAIFVIEATPR